MKLIKTFNAGMLIIALVLYLVVGVVYLITESLSVEFQIVFGVAVALSLYYILVNIFNVGRGLRKKTVQEGIGLMLLTPALFGVVCFIYLIAQGHNKRFDLTASQKFSLSPQSINILANLSKDITVYAFFNEAQEGREYVKTKLEQYKYHSNRFSFEFVDPDRQPQKAKEYAIENYGEIVIVAGERQEKLKGAVGEEEITNAILKLISDEQKTVCFVQGHGELSVEQMDRMGLGLLKKQLELQNYLVEEISLMRTASLPSSVACLVIVAPKTDLFEEEITLLKQYVVKQGGSVLILADTESPKTIRDLLDGWGVVLGNTMIIDKMSQLFGANYEMAVIAQYEKHPITEQFNIAAFFPTAASLKIKDDQQSGFTEQYLAYSGPGSWAETNLEQLKNEETAALEKNDIPGPIPVGVVLSKQVEMDEINVDAKKEELGWKEGAEEDVEKENMITEKEAKVVVFSDSDFVTNGYLMLSGNKDFILNTFSWLCGDEKLISIGRPQVESTPLFLQKGQTRMLFMISVVIMPMCVLLLGIVVFVQKRRSA